MAQPPAPPPRSHALEFAKTNQHRTCQTSPACGARGPHPTSLGLLVCSAAQLRGNQREVIRALGTRLPRRASWGAILSPH